MPRHVVVMGVRNEGPRLATAKVDRQIGSSQLQAVVPVKQGNVLLTFRRKVITSRRSVRST